MENKTWIKCDGEIGFKVEEDTYFYLKCSKPLNHVGPHFAHGFAEMREMCKSKEGPIDYSFQNKECEFQIQWWAI